MKTLQCSLTKSFDCDIETLFNILTNSRYIKKWSGQEGKIPQKKGASISLFDGWVHGKTLEVNSPNLISFSWQPSDWEEPVESTVTYSLQMKNGKVSLNIKHKGFPNVEQMRSHREGWKQYVLQPVSQYLST